MYRNSAEFMIKMADYTRAELHDQSGQSGPDAYLGMKKSFTNMQIW